MKRYGQAEYMWHIIEKFIDIFITEAICEPLQGAQASRKNKTIKYAPIKEKPTKTIFEGI